MLQASPCSIDDAARKAGGNGKLSFGIADVTDVCREADHWAGSEGRDVASAPTSSARCVSASRAGGRTGGGIMIAHVAAAGERSGRVVLWLGGSAEASRFAIEAAMLLGQAFQAEVESLYVEDKQLFDLADFPFAR